MRTLIKYHRCKRHQNPLMRLAGWHCWRCRRAFQGVYSGGTEQSP